MPDPDPNPSPDSAGQSAAPQGATPDWEAFYGNYRKPDYLPGLDIKEKLGAGMFGMVFRATRRSVGRDYAIKFLKIDDSEVRKAVLSELDSVRWFAQVDHPNLVAIEDMGQVDGIPYIVMGYGGSETLKDRLDALAETGRETPEEREELVRLVLQAARGLAALHARSLVHFDLKPANVFLKGGVARLGDYGLSRLMAGSHNTLSVGRGTPYYMAPELLQHKGDQRSDVYSLGVMLYEVVVGDLPFDGSSEWEVLRKHETEPPEFPDDLPEVYRRVLGKCLAKQPGDRYQSVDELLEALGVPGSAAEAAVADVENGVEGEPEFSTGNPTGGPVPVGAAAGAGPPPRPGLGAATPPPVPHFARRPGYERGRAARRTGAGWTLFALAVPVTIAAVVVPFFLLVGRVEPEVGLQGYADAVPTGRQVVISRADSSARAPEAPDAPELRILGDIRDRITVRVLREGSEEAVAAEIQSALASMPTVPELPRRDRRRIEELAQRLPSRDRAAVNADLRRILLRRSPMSDQELTHLADTLDAARAYGMTVLGIERMLEQDLGDREQACFAHNMSRLLTRVTHSPGLALRLPKDTRLIAPQEERFNQRVLWVWGRQLLDRWDSPQAFEADTAR